MAITDHALTYPCHGLHASLPRGKASGYLSFDAMSVRFVVAEQTFTLPLQSLVMEQGGASNRLLFFSHPACPEWRFYSAERILLNNPHLKAQPHLRQVAHKAKSKRAVGWGLLVAVLALVILLPLWGLMNLDKASALLAEQVPLEWEQQLGESSFAQYQLQAELMPLADSNALLAPLTEPLFAALPDRRFDYQFYIQKSSELNAFALPGGIVVVNSELILQADNASELLGVVAHEIAHVRERHGIRNVISHAGLYVVVSSLFGDASGLMAVLVDASPLLVSQSYSRQFEAEADQHSYQLLQQANINPHGLASFFAKLLEKEQQQQEKLAELPAGEWIQVGTDFLSSHPATQVRISQLAQMEPLRQGLPYRDLSAEFKQLQQHVTTFISRP